MLFPFNDLPGQQTEVDSLKELLAAVSEPASQATLLIQLATVTSEVDEAITHATSAIDLAEEMLLDSLLTAAYRKRAQVQQKNGLYPAALTDYKIALDRCRLTADSNLLSALMIDLATVHTSLGDLSFAEEWLLKALTIDRARRDSLGIAAALTNLAGIANRLGNIDQSAAYLDTVLLLDSLREDWLYFGRGLANIALLYKRQERLVESTTYALRALKATEKSNDDVGQYMSSSILSDIHIQLRDYGAALNYGHRAVRHAEAYGNHRILGSAYLLLQHIYQEQNVLDSATYYFELGVEYADPGRLSVSYNNWGTYHRDIRGDTTTAEAWYEQATKTAKEAGILEGTYVPLINLAMIAAAREEWTTALSFLEEASPYSKLEVDLKPASLTTIGRIYSRNGELKRANSYLLQAADLRDQQLKDRDSTRALTASYERELEILRRKSETERADFAERAVWLRNRYLTGGTVLLLFLIGAVWSTIRRGQRLAKANDQLEVLREEVHHRVRNDFQSIASMFFVHLNVLDDQPLRKTMDRIYKRVKNLGQVHALLQEEDGKGLSLKDHLHQLIKRRLINLETTIPVRFDYNYGLPAIAKQRFSPLQLQQLGIIINELVTNASKYAFEEHTAPLLTFQAKSDNTDTYFFHLTDNGQASNNFEQSDTNSFGLSMIQSICQSQGWLFESKQSTTGRHSVIQIPLVK